MKRILTVVTLLAAIVCVAMLFMTNPLQSGPIGILAVFVSLYITLVGVIAFLMHGISRLLAHRQALRAVVRRPFEAISLLHSYYYASALALGPVMLLGIGSVSKISITEITLIVIFVVAACIYIRKMSSNQ